jgi:DNA-binding NarL/FixJ family response regulator
MKYSILLADDHVLILKGLKDFLLTIECVQNVGIAENSAVMMNQLQMSTYDLLFLDIHFGNSDGRTLFTDILKLQPNLKVAALTSFDDKETIRSVVNFGFNAYFLKSDALSEIQYWIEKGDFESIYLSNDTRKSFTNQELLGDIRTKSNLQLTEREKEVLRLLTEELTSKKIAEKLNLSEKTIENYRANLMLKLDVTNVVGLVKKAIYLGLTT